MRALAVKADNQKRVKVSQIYGDYLIMLAAPCLVAWRYYGARALLVIAVSVLTAELCDLLACLALGRRKGEAHVQDAVGSLLRLYHHGLPCLRSRSFCLP